MVRPPGLPIEKNRTRFPPSPPSGPYLCAIGPESRSECAFRGAMGNAPFGLEAGFSRLQPAFPGYVAGCMGLRDASFEERGNDRHPGQMATLRRPSIARERSTELVRIGTPSGEPGPDVDLSSCRR